MRYQTALRPDAVVDCTKRGLGSEWRTGMDSGAECQVNEPCDEEDGHGEYDKYDQPHGCEKEQVAPVVTPRVLEMPGEQRVVAAVGLPCDVEGVSQEWHGADDDVEREIDQHARDGDIGCAPYPCGNDDDAGGEAGEDVADAGDQADDTVQSEANRSAGDAEPGVEQAAEQVEIFVAKEAVLRADARVWRQDLGFALFVASSGGHGLGLLGLL